MADAGKKVPAGAGAPGSDASGEAKFQALFESSQDAIMLLDEKGFFDCNRATLEMFGLATKAEFAALHPAELSPPVQADGEDSRTAADRRIAAALREGHQRFEWLHRRKSGEVFPAEVWLTAFRLGGRSVLQATVRDITESRLTQARLRESEQHFSEVVNRALVGVFRTTMAGQFVLANPATLRIFGYDSVGAFNAAGGVMALYADPQDRRHLLEALQRGPVTAMEMPFLRSDGGRIRLAVSAVLVRDDAGEPKYIEGTVDDITERSRAEQALRESERKLLAMIDLLPDAAFIIDREGRIVAWNKAIQRLLGYRAEEMLGKGDHEYSIPFYGVRRPILIDLVRVPDTEIETKYTTVRREGDVLIGEAYVEPPRGEGSYMLGLARALYDENGEYTGAIEIAHDFTERKRMEEALRQAKEVAESAARARSEFVANMSHEIRTPMNGILGMLDLALATELSREQREYLGLAKSAADSLLTVIDDILDFSKIEAKKLDLEEIEFRLSSLCEEILPLVGLEAHKKGLELVCQMDPTAPEVLVGDPVRLKQVLINLLRNAVKFTEKGHILLRAEKRDVPGAAAGELHFSVTDTGVGIPADKLELIFESFTQADSSMTRRFGGTGLGLTICKSLVEMMGGAIWVESRFGKGSTFHFTVPLRSIGPERPALRRGPPELRGLRTLVVDDNEVNRRILRGYLESWGMTVEEAGDGQGCIQAVRKARAESREFGLVLLDCMMPGMSGFDVAEKLVGRDSFENPIVVMLSSMEQQGSRERCRALGVSRFLVKPVSPSTLHDAIVGVIGLEPREAERKTAPRPAARAAADLPRGARILVAEDNPVNIELVKRLLQRAGLSCDVAVNGQEAVEALERASYDLVLMDVQMPVMDGMEATQKIRQREKAAGGHIPIVALTAHSMKGDRARFLAVGMDDYLSKPLEAVRLYETIGRQLRGPEPAAEAQAPAAGGAAAAPSGRELLDPQDLLDRMGDDRELIAEVLAMFLAEGEKALAGVEEAFGSGDAGRLRSAAHYFKSMSANVSAKALREACYEIEKLGAEGQVEEAGRRLDGLRETAKLTAAAVREYLGKP